MDTQPRKSFSDLIGGDTPVLVDFSAEWCGPCKMMKPVLQELKTQLGTTVTIIKIDIDQSPQLARHYNIQSVPTLLLFQHNKILWRQSGAVQAAAIRQAIQPFIP